MLHLVDKARRALEEHANMAIATLVSPAAYGGFERFHDSVKQEFLSKRMALAGRAGRITSVTRRIGVQPDGLLFNEFVVIDLFGSLLFGEQYVAAVSGKPREQRQVVGSLLAALSGNNLQCPDLSIEIDCLLAELENDFKLKPLHHVHGELIWLYVTTSGYAHTRGYVRSDLTLDDVDNTPGELGGLDQFVLAKSLADSVKLANPFPYLGALRHNIGNITDHFQGADLTMPYTARVRLELRNLCEMLLALVVDEVMAKGSNVDIIFGIESHGLFSAYVRDVNIWAQFGGLYRPLRSRCVEYKKHWPWLPMFWDMLDLPEDVTIASEDITVYALCVSAIVVQHGKNNGGFESQMGIVGRQ